MNDNGSLAYVTVAGTVVDGSGGIIGEDFEEWEPVREVSISLGKDLATHSDFRGSFSLSVTVEAPGALEILFRKEGFKLKTVSIPVIEETSSQDHRLLVKMFPASAAA
jgi:hypothetical protein